MFQRFQKIRQILSDFLLTQNLLGCTIQTNEIRVKQSDLGGDNEAIYERQIWASRNHRSCNA